MKQAVISELLARFPKLLRLAVKTSKNQQRYLLTPSNHRIAVVACKRYRSPTGIIGWVTNGVPQEAYDLSFLIRRETNDRSRDYVITEKLSKQSCVHIREDSSSLARGIVFSQLSEFANAVNRYLCHREV